MNVFVWMQVSVSNEKIQNNDRDVGFEISTREFFFNALDGPKKKRFRLSVCVDRTEVQRQRQIETKFPEESEVRGEGRRKGESS